MAKNTDNDPLNLLNQAQPSSSLSAKKASGLPALAAASLAPPSARSPPAGWQSQGGWPGKLSALCSSGSLGRRL